jgi:hypothetical protein
VLWLNVTSGYEKGTADDEELLSGFVWVPVSAQQVGVTRLVRTNGSTSSCDTRPPAAPEDNGWTENRGPVT